VNGGFEIFYGEALYPPQISRPDYNRGFYYCVRCMTAYKDADLCPNCGTKTRKKGRKNGNGEKSRIDIEFDENDIT